MTTHLNNGAARPSEIIWSQHEVIREQAQIIDVLKGALAATGMSAAPAGAKWMTTLTGQERALVGVLYAAYPRALDRHQILEFLPGYDHVRERRLGVVSVVVHNVRRKLGREALVTQHGVGYRLSDSFYEALPKESIYRAVNQT